MNHNYTRITSWREFHHQRSSFAKKVKYTWFYDYLCIKNRGTESRTRGTCVYCVIIKTHSSIHIIIIVIVMHLTLYFAMIYFDSEVCGLCVVCCIGWKLKWAGLLSVVCSTRLCRLFCVNMCKHVMYWNMNMKFNGETSVVAMRR